jgi:hypothetical protein
MDWRWEGQMINTLLFLSIIGLGKIEFQVVDNYAGIGVSANVRVVKNGVEIRSLKTNLYGYLAFEEREGQYSFIFEAPNYRTLKTHFLIEDGKTLKVEIRLDRANEPNTKMKREEGLILIEGYVVDYEKRQPIEGVRVRSLRFGLSQITDSSGHFSLKLPVVEEKGVIPPQDTLIFEKSGFRSLELRNVILTPDVHLIKVKLKRGEGVDFEEKKHGLLLPKERREERKIDGKERGETESLNFLDPPSSIRVGLNCYCTDCYSVVVMSLESYVQTGLDDEWLSSWQANSLRAGAIAYRSYGAWYIYHPVSVNYDICSSTCCQIWEDDEAWGTINAAIYTSGMMLETNGSVAKSEYSAENNNSGCGDCYSGTGSDWPCIYDPVCCGYPSNGHGRGLCQWGSERWAINGESWDWIVNHYYNPAGFYLSTPIEILSSYPSPDSLMPGDTLTIYLQLYNGAEDEHTEIMIGASLYREGQYYDDPENDKKITVPPGNSEQWRTFVTSNLDPGWYDLLVALWFDIDEDNVIDPTDLPLQLSTLTDAVYIMPLFICGDVNNNGAVEVSDLVYLANYFFQGGQPPEPWQSADVNGNCLLEPSDLSYLAFYLFLGGNSPNCCTQLLSQKSQPDF